MHAERNPNLPGIKRNDPTLGIAIGVVLSILCVFVCLAIIVWHRRKIKRNQSNATASPNATSSSVVKIGTAFDQHEMETLITKPHTDASSFHVLGREVAVPIEAGLHISRCNGYKEETSSRDPTDNVAGCQDRCEGSSSDGKYGFIFSSTPKREDSDKIPDSIEDTSLIITENPIPDVNHSNNENLPEFSLQSNNNVTTSTHKKPPRKIEVIQS